MQNCCIRIFRCCFHFGFVLCFVFRPFHLFLFHSDCNQLTMTMVITIKYNHTNWQIVSILVGRMIKSPAKNIKRIKPSSASLAYHDPIEENDWPLFVSVSRSIYPSIHVASSMPLNIGDLCPSPFSLPAIFLPFARIDVRRSCAKLMCILHKNICTWNLLHSLPFIVQLAVYRANSRSEKNIEANWDSVSSCFCVEREGANEDETVDEGE